MYCKKCNSTLGELRFEIFPEDNPEIPKHVSLANGDICETKSQVVWQLKTQRWVCLVCDHIGQPLDFAEIEKSINHLKIQGYIPMEYDWTKDNLTYDSYTRTFCVRDSSTLPEDEIKPNFNTPIS